jgi:hypothetical protein
MLSMGDPTTSLHRSNSEQASDVDAEESAVWRNGRITQQLVDEIADKVWAMLLQDAKNANERNRLPFHGPRADRGGW